MQDPNEPLLKNLAFILFCFSAIGAAIIWLIHGLSPNPRLIDLLLPPINGLINVILAICLYRNWMYLERAFRIWLLAILPTIGITIFFFLVQAIFNENFILSQELPPIAPALLLVYMNTAVFAKPKEVLQIGVFSWLLIALPVLIYLIVHPSELFTARGTELFVMFGPAMVFALILVEFNKIIDYKIKTLQHEREQLQLLSEKDPLTQLYNRRGINKRIQALTNNSDVAIGLILFDIDHFKKINDQYGHDIGDMVLFEIAQRCGEVLGENDMMARWGGEEFLIVMLTNKTKNIEAQDKMFTAIAEHLRQAIAARPIGEIEQVTASFGVTRLKFGSKNPLDLSIKCADEAMYLAKKQGRDRVVMHSAN